jgi:threonine dehydrogenase-like Zn-dependent dehydrogenase
MAGRVDPAALTSHTFTFGELAHAFDIMDHKTENVVKPLIVS